MISNFLRTVAAVCLATLFLTACGGASPDTDSAPATLADSSPSKLGQFAGADICKILAPDDIQRLFAPKSEVKTNSHVGKRRVSCSYVWARPDAKERKQAMVAAVLEQMKPGGAAAKLNSRAFSTEYSIHVSLHQTRATAENFVPRKLSEAQLEARIEQVRKRADAKLTDAQKQAVGKHGVENMAGNLLRAANERTVVEGVGDAAYWDPVASGSLRVLVGDQELGIGAKVGDDKADDIEAAKKIYDAITS